MEFIELKGNYLELKDDGTYIKHRVQFGRVSDKLFRVDTDDNGNEIGSVVRVRTQIEVDKVTDNILVVDRGFDPEREILGVKLNKNAKKENVIIEESDFPVDMFDVNGKITYKFNRTTKKLEKKT